MNDGEVGDNYRSCGGSASKGTGRKSEMELEEETDMKTKIWGE